MIRKAIYWIIMLLAIPGVYLYFCVRNNVRVAGTMTWLVSKSVYEQVVLGKPWKKL